MPLLTLITRQALDEDYLVAAERRAAGGPCPPRGRPQRTTAIVIAVFGILVSTAAVQTSRTAGVDDASRAALVQRIDNQRDRVATQQERLAGLRESNAVRESRLSEVTDSTEALDNRRRRLQIRTGLIPVGGEGVRVVVENAPGAGPVELVRDEDLALLANGLWSAGAEAISLNGQRLTAMTAIRNSGSAVEVNSVGVSPPYTMLAIGDTRTLQANFFDTSSGLSFDSLSRNIGFTYEMRKDEELALPAGPDRFQRLRSAETRSDDETAPRAEEVMP